MTKINVAVTGVGGGVGQGILKCLSSSRYRLIGLDADFEATGLYTVDRAYVIPRASDKQYINTLLKICEQERCSFLFPGLDTELPKLARHVNEFQKIGTRVIVSSPAVIRIADDKYLTYEFLKAHGIPVPRTTPLEDYRHGEKMNVIFPVVMKPLKGGSRSADVSVLKNEKELQWILQQRTSNNYVLQEYIPGDEYTCGTINFDGECYGVIVMRRELRAGDTYKCFTVRDRKIEDVVTQAMNALKPLGACNVQLRLKNGVPTVFEINARCSGTTAARAFAGFNEPMMIIEYFTRGRKPASRIKEISVLRYWQELVVENEKISAMQALKKSEGKVHQL